MEECYFLDRSISENLRLSCGLANVPPEISSPDNTSVHIYIEVVVIKNRQ